MRKIQTDSGEEEKNKIEETVTKSPILKLLPGEKDRTDWLNGLPEKTVFLAKPKNINQGPSWLLTEFHVIVRIVDNMGKCYAVQLATDPHNPNAYLWVDPIQFSYLNILVKILLHGEKDIAYE